ncbi:MAG: lipoprotein [Legionellaceae bacterium]|nr:lipoprotein [Legionellaceae bacterium]
MSWLRLSLVILSLSACGQKGPLYLPDDQNKQEQSHESKIYKNARAGQ